MQTALKLLFWKLQIRKVGEHRKNKTSLEKVKWEQIPREIELTCILPSNSLLSTTYFFVSYSANKTT